MRQGTCRPGKTCKSCLDKPGLQVEQAADGKADDVEVVALQAPDQRSAGALDRVATGALAPLPRPQVPLDEALVEVAERDVGHLDGGANLALAHEREPADDLVRAAPEPAQRLARRILVGRLAPDVEAGRDERVDAEDQV